MAKIDFSVFEQCVEEYGIDQIRKMIDSFHDYGFSTLESIGIDTACSEADSFLPIDEKHKNGMKEDFNRLHKTFDTISPYIWPNIANSNFINSSDETLPLVA